MDDFKWVLMGRSTSTRTEQDSGAQLDVKPARRLQIRLAKLYLSRSWLMSLGERQLDSFKVDWLLSFCHLGSPSGAFTCFYPHKKQRIL